MTSVVRPCMRLVGTTAIQMGKLFGAHVLVTAGSAEKVRACEELGADHAINYRSEDFVEVVKEVTRGHASAWPMDLGSTDMSPPFITKFRLR